MIRHAVFPLGADRPEWFCWNCGLIRDGLVAVLHVAARGLGAEWH